jgi:3-mercaptopyruvate sulfurtransferase SseA
MTSKSADAQRTIAQELITRSERDRAFAARMLEDPEGDAGIVPNGSVITYCRIGERSSQTWFVLAELLGYPGVRKYDGSWTAYGSLVGDPVETGP